MNNLPALGHRGEGWVAVQLLLIALVALAGLLGPVWNGTPRLATSSVGVILVGVGVGFAVLGVRHLHAHDALTALPYPRHEARLVQTGVYGIVRHPIYSGLIISSFGWALLTASPPAIALSGVLLAFFELKSRREEAWLERRFPGYLAYQARTPRLIPWLGGARGSARE
jgi:protein-S-isoprenylcysteine O-methyltransferase Ste14